MCGYNRGAVMFWILKNDQGKIGVSVEHQTQQTFVDHQDVLKTFSKHVSRRGWGLQIR